jgi:alpha-tubulin suppressor-like RCC1 family protein
MFYAATIENVQLVPPAEWTYITIMGKQETQSPQAMEGSPCTSSSKRRLQLPGKEPSFVTVARGGCVDGANHAVGITDEGVAYTWGGSNALGQLGRKGRAKFPLPACFDTKSLLFSDTTSTDRSTATPTTAAATVRADRAYVGGMSDSGHTVIVDTDGRMWVAGSDRWQQLGLGSPHGGGGGYTWEAVYRTRFVPNTFVPALLAELDRRDEPTMSSDIATTTATATRIRDVAIGGDHTVVLSSNQRDVVTFGKGAEGQLGMAEKRFVSAPTKSPVLSAPDHGAIHKKKTQPAPSPPHQVAAVCAVQNCSVTLDADGRVLAQAGKCRTTMESFAAALDSCVHRARLAGLLRREEQP